jgi:hypothetical protein
MVKDTEKSFNYLVASGITAIIVAMLLAVGFTFQITNQANQDREEDFNNGTVESEIEVDNLDIT